MALTMSKVLSRGDSSSVTLMKEIREGTEGKKFKLAGIIEFHTMPASKIKVDDLDKSDKDGLIADFHPDLILHGETLIERAVVSTNRHLRTRYDGL